MKNNILCLIYPNSNQYSMAMIDDLKRHQYVEFYRKPNNKFVEFIRNVHTSIRSNKLSRLPFQSLWYKFYEPISLEGLKFIVFFQGNSLGYDVEYLSYLRRKHPKCKLCFFWLNIIAKTQKKYVNIVNNNYDIILSFDPNDCRCNDWIYFDTFYSHVENWPLPKIQSSDIFFVGSAKGRLETLHHIYDVFTSNGFKCDFHIVNVPKEFQTRKGIIYNQRLSYIDVLSHCKSTRVILEVVQKGQNGITLRTCEAIRFRKKLLTNNTGLKNTALDGKYISYFDNIEALNINEIFNKHIDESAYKDAENHIDPNRFISFMNDYLIFN